MVRSDVPARPEVPPAPVRTCVGCRQRSAKHDLLRVVAVDSGGGLELLPDPRGRAPGRGAHLHPTPECLQQALRRRAFRRALRVPEGTAGPASARLEHHLRDRGATGQDA